MAKVMLSIPDDEYAKIGEIAKRDFRTKSSLFTKLALEYGKSKGYLSE